MMKLTCLLLSVTTLQAALPPLAQSAREIREIVSDSRLYHALGSAETILQINQIEEGYEIRTAHQSMVVSVIFLPSTMPGPANFKLEFSDPVALD